MVWALALVMVLTCGFGQLVGAWCLSLVGPKVEFGAKNHRVGYIKAHLLKLPLLSVMGSSSVVAG